MKLHPSKCEVLCISNKYSPPEFDYKINNFLLKWCSPVRYLGVYISSKLLWNDHCYANAAKAARVLNILRCTLYDCSISMKPRGFRELVIPILEYAAQVWNPRMKKNVEKL